MASHSDSEIKAIALVDDHPLVSGAIASILTQFVPDAQIQSFVTVGDAAQAAAGGWAPDLLLLDLHLPDGCGPGLIRRMRDVWPDSWIAVCSGMVDRPTVMQCIDEGACGFIPKNVSGEEIADAIETILEGRVYLPREIVSPIRGRAKAADAPATLAPEVRTLTAKQMEVVQLMIRGLSNKDIARQLDMAAGTVKAHVSAIIHKLGVNSRVEAIVAAIRLSNLRGGISGPQSDDD